MEKQGSDFSWINYSCDRNNCTPSSVIIRPTKRLKIMRLNCVVFSVNNRPSLIWSSSVWARTAIRPRCYRVLRLCMKMFIGPLLHDALMNHSAW